MKKTLLILILILLLVLTVSYFSNHNATVSIEEIVKNPQNYSTKVSGMISVRVLVLLIDICTKEMGFRIIRNVAPIKFMNIFMRR